MQQPFMPDDDSALIEQAIQRIGDWRGELLAEVRKLTREADPDVVEEIKWRKPSNPDGVPTWTHDGILFTGQPFKGKLKLTFEKGASLEDPAGLFNASLEAKVSRAIDFYEGDTIDARAFKALVRAAVDYNRR
jgi:hypothetical protein